MVTYEMILAEAKKFGEDFEIRERIDEDGEPVLNIDYNNGYWNYERRFIHDDDMFDDFEELLEDNANEVIGGCYTYYFFDGFSVVRGYTSLDE